METDKKPNRFDDLKILRTYFEECPSDINLLRGTDKCVYYNTEFCKRRRECPYYNKRSSAEKENFS